MSRTWIGSLSSILALALVASAAQAQSRHHRHAAHRAAHVAAFSGAENGLVGIHLFDTGEHVIGVYGSPDDIQPLTFGSAQTTGGFGGGGGFGSPGGAPGGPGGPGRLGGRPGGGGGGGGPAGAADVETADGLRSQFEFGDPLLQGRKGEFSPGGSGGMGGPRQGGFPGGSGRPGGPGMPGGGPGMPGGGPGMPGGRGAGGSGGGGAPAGGGATESVTYTRWIYNRSNNKFAFVMNRLGQVIQIEAIGLSNPKVKTKRGIAFGSQFGAIVKAYHNPDGYDIGGDNILVKYLVNDKVAFRLTRIGEKKPHQVTGIVVSAGKG